MDYHLIDKYIRSIFTELKDIEAINRLNQEYLMLFLENIISNCFSSSYILLLTKSEIINKIFSVISSNNITNKTAVYLINMLKKLLVQFNVQSNITCMNCNSKIQDGLECEICGVNNNNMFNIEDKQKDSYQYLRKTKNKQHNPNNHCKTWLIQLQGKENILIKTEMLQNIFSLAKDYIEINKLTSITYDLVRLWLKQCKLSCYNPHITWIKNQIEIEFNLTKTDCFLSDDEMQAILDIFDRVYTLFLEVIREHKFNQKNIFYPFYISKIIPLVITDEARLKTLNAHLHKQSVSTTQKNDIIWSQIIQRLSEKMIINQREVIAETQTQTQ